MKLLAARDLWCWIAGRPVLRGASLVIAAGEAVVITGENGSGKSTLLACLAGLRAPDRGEIEGSRALGFCPQEPALWPHLTPREHFALFGAAARLEGARLEERTRELGERFRFAQELDRPMHALSGGTRQKLNLCLALLADPPLLLLDEPYAGFDVETYRCFIDWVSDARARGRAILAVTHLSMGQLPWTRELRLAGGSLHAG